MKCSFCGTEIQKGTGIIFVKNDAKIFYFCSRKCEKNVFKLGHKARKTSWTEEARKNKITKKVVKKVVKSNKNKKVAKSKD